jgi:hypothetical protein
MSTVESERIERKLNNLKQALQGVLASDEREIVLERAKVLLKKKPRINRIEGVVKRIISERKDRLTKESIEQMLNHIAELNLAFHFSQLKWFDIEIERQARRDTKKRVDITVFSKKNYYIEVKSFNEPRYSKSEEAFLKGIQGKLEQIKKPYYIDFYFFDQGKLKNGSLIGYIKERAEIVKDSSIEDTDRDASCVPTVYFYYPNQHEPLLAFSFRKNRRLHQLESCLYEPSQGSEGKHIIWIHKKSLIRDIRHAEQKFPKIGDNVNILAINLGGWGSVELIEDIVNWYYCNQPVSSNRDEKISNFDRLFEFYDLYAKRINFVKDQNIDAFVALKGKGFKGSYKTFIFAKSGIDGEKIRNIFA